MCCGGRSSLRFMIATFVRNRLAWISICDKTLNATMKAYVVVCQSDDPPPLKLGCNCLCQDYLL